CNWRSTTTRERRLFTFCLLSDDGAFTDFQKRFVRAQDDKTGISDFLDFADNAAAGDDFVVDFQAGNHFLQLLRLPALRHNHEKIKNTENKYKRQKRPNETSTLTLKK
ncbi:MAG TPA: hypothetical protein VGB00_10965, partial [Pyrinomonadaceae bacterium]